MTDVVFNSLLDQASLNYLSDKKLVQGFSHYDVWLKEHQIAFTVAKMMDDDMLAEVKAALERAIQNGTDFNTFKKQLVPYLMSRGWWGEQVMGDPLTGEIKKVQLGSFRRLKTIFETNLSTAYAAGQWARISDSAEDFPYLKYLPSVSSKKRDTHKKYYNQIWRVNDPIWQSIFPPNGYGCQCSVRQLNEKQALRERHEDIKNQPENFTDEQKANAKAGIIDDKNRVKWVDFTNPRTGEIVRVPDNVTPSFAHNHGDRLGSLLSVYADKHGEAAISSLKQQLNAYTLGKLGNDVQMVDFSDIEPEQEEINRLTVLNGQNTTTVHEAHAAAQWQQYFGEKLHIYDLPILEGVQPPDFMVESKLPKEQWQTLDFMFTANKTDAKTIYWLNYHFALTPDHWARKVVNIERHLQKADIVPLDLRHLNAENRAKLLAYVLSLPENKRKKIYLITGNNHEPT